MKLVLRGRVSLDKVWDWLTRFGFRRSRPRVGVCCFTAFSTVGADLEHDEYIRRITMASVASIDV